MDLSQRNRLDPFRMLQVSIIFTYFGGIGVFLCLVTLLAHFYYTSPGATDFYKAGSSYGSLAR